MKKYTPQTVEKITRVLRRCGDNATACEAADISETTFTAWMRKYPDFKEQVVAARHFFKTVSLKDEDALIGVAFSGILERLKGRTVEKTHIIDRELDPNDMVLNKETMEEAPRVLRLRERVVRRSVPPSEKMLLEFMPAILSLLQIETTTAIAAVLNKAVSTTPEIGDPTAREKLVQVMDSLEREVDGSGLGDLLKQLTEDGES